MPKESEDLVDVVEAAEVARALFQLILALVEPPVAKRILDEETVKQVNRLADIAEVAKFGTKN